MCFSLLWEFPTQEPKGMFSAKVEAKSFLFSSLTIFSSVSQYVSMHAIYRQWERAHTSKCTLLHGFHKRKHTLMWFFFLLTACCSSMIHQSSLVFIVHHSALNIACDVHAVVCQGLCLFYVIGAQEVKKRSRFISVQIAFWDNAFSQAAFNSTQGRFRDA